MGRRVGLRLLAWAAFMALAFRPAAGQAVERLALPSQETPSAAERAGAKWVVVPDKIRPWRAPSLLAARKGPQLAYRQVLQGPAVRPRAGDESAQDPAPGRKPTEKEAPKFAMRWVRFASAGGEDLYLPVAYAVRQVAGPPPGVNLPIGAERVDRWTPLSLAYKPNDLVKLSVKWSYHAGRTHRLRREAAKAAERMLGDAKKRGVHLRIVSATRSSSLQRKLYLNAIERNGLFQDVVAKPGHSEHQLGTTLDVSGLDPETVISPVFGERPEGVWVRDNAARYGFSISYTARNQEDTGYTPEPWHIRYMGKGKAEVPNR